MFRITRQDSNRIDIELSGKLDAGQMQTALDELASSAAGIEHGLMMYEIIDFHMPSLGALAIEFSRLPSLFGLIRRFDRAAVLTDKNWLKRASELEGALIPGLEIKAFSRDQRQQAEDWLLDQQSD